MTDETEKALTKEMAKIKWLVLLVAFGQAALMIAEVMR